ncbi:MAG: hypothetical protein U0457_20910 [Candidatus Sericytochromatia bacterium]
MNKLKKLCLVLTTLIVTGCSFTVPLNIPLEYLDNNQESSILRKKSDELIPDGKSKFEWNLKLTNSNGKKLANKKVKFTVLPINPEEKLRNVDYLAKKYGSTATKFKTQVNSGVIRLLGTISPKEGFTNENGEIKVTYTASNMGSNTEESGQEKIVASYDDETKEQIINLSYPDMVAIPTVDNYLRISGATGTYVNKKVAIKLLSIVDKIKALNWNIPITITAGNLRHGGLYPPHFTHRTGLEIDFRPMSKDGNPTYCNPDGSFGSNYDREKTSEFIKLAKSEGITEIFFNDPKLANLGVEPLEGHSDHLHISFSIK